MTKEEFIKYYRGLSILNDKEWERMLETNEVVECSCGLSICKGWAVVTKKL